MLRLLTFHSLRLTSPSGLGASRLRVEQRFSAALKACARGCASAAEVPTNSSLFPHGRPLPNTPSKTENAYRSRILPSQSPPHSKPAPRKISIRPAFMSPACALSIARRIQINCNAPTMGRRLGSSPLLAECEAAPEAGNLRLQPARLHLNEHRRKYFHHASIMRDGMSSGSRSWRDPMPGVSRREALRWRDGRPASADQARRLAGCNRKCRQRFRRSPAARAAATGRVGPSIVAEPCAIRGLSSCT